MGPVLLPAWHYGCIATPSTLLGPGPKDSRYRLELSVCKHLQEHQEIFTNKEKKSINSVGFLPVCLKGQCMQTFTC